MLWVFGHDHRVSRRRTDSVSTRTLHKRVWLHRRAVLTFFLHRFLPAANQRRRLPESYLYLELAVRSSFLLCPMLGPLPRPHIVQL